MLFMCDFPPVVGSLPSFLSCGGAASMTVPCDVQPHYNAHLWNSCTATAYLSDAI